MAGRAGDRRGGAALLDWLQERYPRAAHGHSVESMRALRARDRRAVSRAQPRPDVPAPPRARRAIRRAPATPSRCAEEALEVFLAARNRVEFYDDVRPALERLRARYRLFAVSNGNADLQRCGIGDLFDGHVTAIAAGAAKPDARIFAALRDMAGRERRARYCTSAMIRSPTWSARGKRACRPCGSIASRARWPDDARAARAHHFDARGNFLAPQWRRRGWQPTTPTADTKNTGYIGVF